MLGSSIVAPPSPNWYGSQLLSLQSATGQATYAGHNSVVVCCTSSGVVQKTLCAGPSRVTAVAWSPPSISAHQLVAGHEDGSFRTWDTKTGACVRSNKKKGAEVSAVVLLERQPGLAVIGDIKGGLQTWAFQSADKPKPFPTPLRSQITHLVAIQRSTASPSHVNGNTQGGSQPASHESPQLVAAACADGTVHILDIDAGTVLQRFSAHRGVVQSLSCLPVHDVPASMRHLGCTVLATASGPEGTAKVWQVAVGPRHANVTLLATLPGPGSRDAGGGRHSKQRANNTPNQWMSAALLPTPPAASLVQVQAGANANAKGDGEEGKLDSHADNYCWVAMGVSSGEIWVHSVDADSGKVGSPFKIVNIHNRPIYSIAAMYLPPQSAGAITAVKDAAQHGEGGSGSESEDDGASHAKQQSDDTHDGITGAAQGKHPQDDQAGAESKAHPKHESGSSQKLSKTSDVKSGMGRTVIATVSQDRYFAVTRLKFKLKPAAAQQQEGSKQDKKLVTKPSKDQPGIAIAESQSKVVPGLATSPVLSVPSAGIPIKGKRMSLDGRAHHSPVFGNSPGSPAPGTSPGSYPKSHGLQHLHQHMQLHGHLHPDHALSVKTAVGPPADKSITGFTCGRGRSLSSAGSAASRPPSAPGAVDSAGNAGDDVDIASSKFDSDHSSPRTSPVPPSPAHVAVKQATSRLAVSSDVATTTTATTTVSALTAAIHESAAGTQSLLTKHVSGFEPFWKIQGLGGYAHCLHVRNNRPSPNISKTHKDRRVSQWDLAVGCGDKTMRTMVLDWPFSVHAAARKVHHEAPADTHHGVPPAPATNGTSGHVSGEAAGSGDVAGKAALVRATAGLASLKSSCCMWKGLGDQVICIAHHPASTRYLAFGCQDGQVGIYDTVSHHPYMFKTRHQGPVLQIHWFTSQRPQSSSSTSSGPVPGDAASTLTGSTAAQQVPGVSAHQDARQSPEPRDDREVQVSDSEGHSPSPPPPPPPPLPIPEHVQVESTVASTVSSTTYQQDVLGAVSEPAADSGNANAAKPGKGKGKNKGKDKDNNSRAHEILVADHAVCCHWQLVTCGAEGRLLTWQLPSLDDWAADEKLAGQQAGSQQHHSSKGAADKAGRWGIAGRDGGPQDMSNDLASRLLPHLPQPQAGSTGPVSMSTVAVVQLAVPGHETSDQACSDAHAKGSDVLVVATSAGDLAVLKPYTAAAGAAGAAAPLQQQAWQALWHTNIHGAAPTHIAAAVHPQEANTLLLACISSTGVVTCHKAKLSAASGAIQSQQAQHSTTTDAYDADNVWQVGDAAKTATAACFLPGAHSLAIAYAQDASVQVWWMAGMPQLQASSSSSILAARQQPQDGFRDDKPVLISTLTGHTDHILALSAHGCSVATDPHTDDHHHQQQQQHNQNHRVQDVTTAAAAGSTTQEEAVISFLFSASRDQSVRGWALHEPQLMKTAKEVAAQKHKQQQEALEAAARQGATASHADTASGGTAHAAGGEVGHTEGPGGDVIQDDEAVRAPSLSHFLHASTAVNTYHAATACDALADQNLVDTVALNVGNSVSSQDTPSFLVAAPGKNDITGLPGARPKGAKKPAVLGAKPILELPGNTSTGSGSMDEVASAAKSALQQLQQLLYTSSSNPAASTADEGGVDPVRQSLLHIGDPVALEAASALPKAPERVILTAMWSGNVRKALQVAVEHSLLSGDLVSMSASLGRPTWSAVTRLYAAQQEHAGQVHVAALHLLALGDRQAAAAVYRRAGLMQEARAVDGAAHAAAMMIQ